MRVLGICLMLALLMPGLARAAGPDLGPLELSSVDTALAQRGLTIDPAPEGKVVGAIHVVNLDVFQPSDHALLVWFNHFHRTTREGHIRRESLLQPGMAYDPRLVEETLRNLRNRQTYQENDPPMTGIAAIVPVQTPTPGTVDLLMVTRDVWSLRFNSDYNYQLGYLVNLNTSLSENNLLGWRKEASLVFLLNTGDIRLGPNYLDPNVLGTRLRFMAAFYEIWGRKVGEIEAGPREGWASRARLEYPLFALSSRWGAFVDGSYQTSVVRGILGKGLRKFNPSTSECSGPADAGVDPNADCAYRRRYGLITSGVTRSIFRPWLVQRITVGNDFATDRRAFLPGFPVEEQQAFSDSYFRRAERTSALYVQYDAFTPRYRTYRDLDSYDLGEDQRIGPWLTLKLGRASTLLGSDRDFFTFKTEAHVNLALGDGFQSVGISWESRRYAEGWLDQLVKGNLAAYSPVLGHALRLVASGKVGHMIDNVHRDLVYIGTLEGLRGYPVDAFGGYNYYVAHLEARSVALPVWSLRLGALVFADAGNASYRWQGLGLYSDAGLGLRLLIPQLNPEPIRCDWAFPMQTYRDSQGLPVVEAGWPGRLSCGFRQAF
jgi:hypothetical protein